ncbi:MAG: LysR family transcriptional regulator [Campylobacteraceae bacterium 4484_166]|nr:MAG: LysR family transcriptional regulator [Campylobacteraceae bacterium 4484_166]
MIRDFNKIRTFLTIARTKSFSQTSKKLGISQPAVTQQIRLIEDYLEQHVFIRKKNGTKLTKVGKSFLTVCQKIEKTLQKAENEVIDIINKKMIFDFGTSFVVGNYILPNYLNKIKEGIKNDVNIEVSTSAEALDKLEDGDVDMALIDVPNDSKNIVFKEWMDDEIVIFSNQKLPAKLTSNDILNYKWVCRDRDSNTRQIFKEALELSNLPDCDHFNIISESSSPTSIINTVLKSDKNSTPTVSIVSKFALEDYISSGMIYISKIEKKINRKLYIAYHKEKKYDLFVDKVTAFLMNHKSK